MEEWRPIPSYFGYYEASSLGRIRNANTHHIKSTRIRKETGYEDVSLVVNGRQSKRLVSRLVCEAFNGPPPSKRHQAAHDNGVSSDNRASNLAWKTVRDNHADKKRHGTLLLGERNPTSKLTKDIVGEIRRRCSSGENVKQVAESYGVHFSTAYRVIQGRYWNHV